MKASAQFLADRTELQKLEPFTAEFAAAAGLGDKDLFALQIVAEELVTNVIDYGGVPDREHAATLDLSVEDGLLTIVPTGERNTTRSCARIRMSLCRPRIVPSGDSGSTSAKS